MFKNIFAIIGVVVVAHKSVVFYDKHLRGCIERRLADIFEDEAPRQ